MTIGLCVPILSSGQARARMEGSHGITESAGLQFWHKWVPSAITDMAMQFAQVKIGKVLDSNVP